MHAAIHSRARPWRYAVIAVALLPAGTSPAAGKPADTPPCKLPPPSAMPPTPSRQVREKSAVQRRRLRPSRKSPETRKEENPIPHCCAVAAAPALHPTEQETAETASPEPSPRHLAISAKSCGRI